MATTRKSCGACSQDMPRSSFSKKQWERKKFRRCRECVEDETPFRRPSKKDYRLTKEEAKVQIEAKAQPVSERQPLDPTMFVDSKTNADKSPILGSEAIPAILAPIELVMASLQMEEGNAALGDDFLKNSMASTIQKECASSVHRAVAKPPKDAEGRAVNGKERQFMDQDILSESNKPNSGIGLMSAAFQHNSANIPAVTTAGDENTIRNAAITSEAQKIAESQPPTQQNRQPLDPVVDSENNTNTSNETSNSSDPISISPASATSYESTAVSLMASVPATATEDQNDSLVAPVSTPPVEIDLGDYEVSPSTAAVLRDQEKALEQEISDEYGDLRALRRVSTQEFLDYKVEPIVNVEEDIYNLLNPVSNESASEAEFAFDAQMKQEKEDGGSKIHERKTSWGNSAPVDTQTEEASGVPRTTMNNEGKSCNDNVASVAGSSSAPHPLPTARESIESDALDWDPSNVALLSPCVSMPRTPPPPAPIEDEEGEDDDDEDDGNTGSERDVFRILSKYSSAIGHACMICILGIIISGLLFPQDHAALLVFSGLSVFLAALMLVAQLYTVNEEGAASNGDKFDVTTLIGVGCIVSILGLILSALLLPSNHSVLLFFAASAVILACSMLVLQLYSGHDIVSNDVVSTDVLDDGLGGSIAVDSLREPLLAREDRHVISDTV